LNISYNKREKKHLSVKTTIAHGKEMLQRVGGAKKIEKSKKIQKLEK
jgi:hypothetical protein